MVDQKIDHFYQQILNIFLGLYLTKKPLVCLYMMKSFVWVSTFFILLIPRHDASFAIGILNLLIIKFIKNLSSKQLYHKPVL
ncbi:hypothetical protein BpHYR1_014076 [Brachionus plicatilis]|uniref:Uncharacterized protein n=1 Tax=Brachionus plicatilis TaxID=10195 RepID=A0A3M7PR56_BRAPC|nr:hypothetical protein BpHYR1_014076 [Brachionus plicatilis]